MGEKFRTYSTSYNCIQKTSVGKPERYGRTTPRRENKIKMHVKNKVVVVVGGGGPVQWIRLALDSNEWRKHVLKLRILQTALNFSAI
jgi:hypothetical protein